MQLNCYDSIYNLPVFNFDRINNTGDLTFLFKKKMFLTKFVKIKFVHKKLENIWAKIYDEFIKEFGLSDEFKLYIEKQKQIINHYYRALCEGQRHEINFAKIKEMEIEEMMKAEQLRLPQLFAKLNKIGYNLNLRTTTVAEFYACIKDING